MGGADRGRDVTVQRMDHVGVVVEDLAAATAFFGALGLERRGEMSLDDRAVDRIVGLDSVRTDVAFMQTPDGHGQLELTRFRHPPLVDVEPAVQPPNALGLRSVMFAVDSIDDTVARLRSHGGALVGEVVEYEDKYRLCYLRGPAGIIVALAEELA